MASQIIKPCRRVELKREDRSSRRPFRRKTRRQFGKGHGSTIQLGVPNVAEILFGMLRSGQMRSVFRRANRIAPQFADKVMSCRPAR